MGRRKEKIRYEVDEKGCWVCISHAGGKWYPRIRVGGKLVLLSRLILEKTTGVIRDDMLALHTCDTPACIRPGHLYWGTYRDNAKDRNRRGRAYCAKGEYNGQAKLTKEQVESIRNSYANSKGRRGLQTELGRIFGVGQACIHKIVCNKSWGLI